MNSANEYFQVSLPLTPKQHRWLENTAAFIEHATGCKASLHSIMLTLMEQGLPSFEDDLEQLRLRSNATTRRFPNLQLAYSRIEQEG